MTKKDIVVSGLVTNAIALGVVYAQNRKTNKQMLREKRALVKDLLKVMRDD